MENHTVILIDGDFSTLPAYFAYAQEIYIVQTQDILTIPQVTKALLNIENKGISLEGKIRIVINKFANVEGVKEKEIINGLSFYNEPTMAYMKQLYEKTSVKYMLFPFEQEVYEKYLSGVAKCDINISNYSKDFLDLLNELADDVYGQ